MQPNQEVTIYLLSQNPRQPRQGFNSNSVDLHFRTSRESIRLGDSRIYQFGTGARIFVRPEDAAHGDVFLLPRSSASMPNKVRSIVYDSEENGDPEVKTYMDFSLRLANTTGLIDWDYRGEITCRIVSAASQEIDLTKPWVQVIPRSPHASFKVVSDESEIPEEWKASTERSEAGFGGSDA